MQFCLPELDHKLTLCITNTSQRCHSQCIVEKFSRIQSGGHSRTSKIPSSSSRILDSAVCIINDVRLTWSNSKADGEKPNGWKGLEVHGLGVCCVGVQPSQSLALENAWHGANVRTENLGSFRFRLGRTNKCTATNIEWRSAQGNLISYKIDTEREPLNAHHAKITLVASCVHTPPQPSSKLGSWLLSLLGLHLLRFPQ